MPRESYDLIVLGDELAGLIAATLCARRGLRVLLAQLEPRPVGYTVGGVRLPIEPLLLPGLGAPALRRVLDELHFVHLIKRKLRVGSPAVQLTAPGARLELDADDAAIARVARRELGDDALAHQLERAAALSASLDRVIDGATRFPPDGFWQRRELGRVGGSLEAEAIGWQTGLAPDPAAALAALPAALTSGSGPAAGPLARARALELIRQGAPRLIGDHEALREIFLDKFASHSGELRTVDPESITTSWGKASGLRLVGGDELGAVHMLAALPVERLAPWLDTRSARKLAETAPAPAAVGVRYTLHMVLDAIGVPEGMGALVLATSDPAAPPIGGNAIALHAGPADEQARVVVTAQAIAPIPPGDPSMDDVLAKLRIDLRRAAEEVMPFSGAHVRLAHSPNQAAPAEGVGAELDVGRIAPPRPLWRAAEGSGLGLAALDYATGIKHLTLVSSQLLPGLGLEGEFLAAWSAARIVCDAAGKKRDFLQSELRT